MKNNGGYIARVTGCMNTLANNYDINASVDNGSCTFAIETITAIINDALPTHAAIVKTAFDDNYEADNAVIFNNTEEDLFEYADAIGTTLIIRSYTGLFSHIPLATQYYPDVLMFMPLGSNSSIELTNPSTLSVIVSCGAGLTTQNQTGYGNGLEFWDVDTYGTAGAESSYTNPIVAAKLLTIKQARNCGWWEARQSARATAIRTLITHPNGEIWNKNNGFGKIDADAAIAYNGSIIPDPFINNTNVYYPYIPS
jgi:hypothetical protein